MKSKSNIISTEAGQDKCLEEMLGRSLVSLAGRSVSRSVCRLVDRSVSLSPYRIEMKRVRPNLSTRLEPANQLFRCKCTHCTGSLRVLGLRLVVCGLRYWTLWTMRHTRPLDNRTIPVSYEKVGTICNRIVYNFLTTSPTIDYIRKTRFIPVARDHTAKYTRVVCQLSKINTCLYEV